MALGRLWAGTAYGTNTGYLFVTLDDENGVLRGKLRLNDAQAGIILYTVEASFDGTHLTITGEPGTEKEGFVLGRLTATAILTSKGALRGEWETDIGSAGTFILHPHDPAGDAVQGEQSPDQLHTARHHFGAIEIDREQLTAIADEIQKDFPTRRLVVTVVDGTEQARFLSDFKTQNFTADRGQLIRLFIQEPEEGGTNKVVIVEFGPQANWVMTQGTDEAWVLGKLERLKRDLRRFERTYTTNFKKFGFGINQVLLGGAVVVLPSLPGFWERAVLMTAALVLVFAVNYAHQRYLPFAAIYLGAHPTNLFAKLAPSAFSWIITIVAGVLEALIAAYMLGWIGLLPPGGN